MTSSGLLAVHLLGRTREPLAWVPDSGQKGPGLASDTQEAGMRPRRLIAALALLGLGYSAFAQEQAKPPATNASPAHIMVGPDAITWQPVPRAWAGGPPPPGFTLGQSEIAIIHGDPAKEGAPFVLRIRSTPGTQLPPHWHPIDENITVLSGVWCLEWETSSMSTRVSTCAMGHPA